MNKLNTSLLNQILPENGNIITARVGGLRFLFTEKKASIEFFEGVQPALKIAKSERQTVFHPGRAAADMRFAIQFVKTL
jgi:hypothetical protein